MTSKKVNVFLHYHKDEKKYEISSSIPLSQHMQKIAQLFGVSNPTIYGLKKSSTTHFLSKNEVSNPELLSQYEGCLLIVEPRPHVTKFDTNTAQHDLSNSHGSAEIEKNPLESLGKVLEDLSSGNPAKEKKVCFDLKGYCTDPIFCQAFAQLQGVEALYKVITKSRGNQLAYGLLALISYCSSGSSFEWVDSTKLKQFEKFFVDTTNPLNVRKSSLQLLNFFTDPKSPVPHLRKQWVEEAISQFPYQEMFQTASGSVTDVTLVEAVLTLVYNTSESLTQSQFEKFSEVQRVDQFISNCLSTIRTNENVYQVIAKYQTKKLTCMNTESAISYDENNTGNLSYLSSQLLYHFFFF